jgi:anhydro-N-acetylmuramic acid kinase
MSGTSLDGVDLCEVIFNNTEDSWKFDILSAETIPYSKEWIQRLKEGHRLSKTEILKLDQDYTALLSEIILSFMEKISRVDLVCSHGHTIWHQPEKGFTYQIGNLKLLREKLQTPVVCDFRTADVQLGGQGAPLVPIGDRLLFANYEYCINIGGFVNISFEDSRQRLAFDICPANKVLNHYAEQLGFAYDEDGQISKEGKCNKHLLEKLNALSYYHQNPPKSLGIEWVEKEIFPVIDSFNISIADKMHTFCHHIAFQISKIIKGKNSVALFTGGGVYNSFLMRLIKEACPNVNVVIPNPQLIEYKEALIFGLLGVLKFRNEVNVLSSVTGAKHDHSSGVVFYD